MVFVAGKHIEDINDFSSNFHGILKLIRDGYEWLKWALTDPSLSVYYAETEQDLLCKIQTGLHETLLLRSDLLTLDIYKAMSVEDADLELLIDVFSSNDAQSASLKSLTSRYGMVGNPQLQKVNTFLEKYELTNSALFQSMNFGEQLELYRFQHGLRNNGVTRESIDFARQKAATCSEFVHYAGFYTGCVANQLSGKQDPVVRQQLVEDIYTELSKVCFNLIYVPNIGSLNPDVDVATYLKDFVLMAKFIGYRLKATAMENLVKNIKVQGVDQENLKVEIDKYLSSSKQKVTDGTFEVGMVPQDGWLRTFTCNVDDYSLVIQIDAKGDVFMSPDSQAV
ncbi:MAG: hypothetical protein AAFN93_23525 [Bacteroidota bacterium]